MINSLSHWFCRSSTLSRSRSSTRSRQQPPLQIQNQNQKTSLWITLILMTNLTSTMFSLSALIMQAKLRFYFPLKTKRYHWSTCPLKTTTKSSWPLAGLNLNCGTWEVKNRFAKIGGNILKISTLSCTWSTQLTGCASKRPSMSSAASLKMIVFFLAHHSWSLQTSRIRPWQAMLKRSLSSSTLIAWSKIAFGTFKPARPLLNKASMKAWVGSKRPSKLGLIEGRPSLSLILQAMKFGHPSPYISVAWDPG